MTGAAMTGASMAEAPGALADVPTWALTPEQRACLDAAGAAPNLVAEIDLPGPVDADRLRRSLAAVAARHDALRTAFVREPGFRGLRQAEAGAPDVPLDLGAEQGDAATVDLAPERGRTLAAALLPAALLPAAAPRLRLVASALAVDAGSLDRLLSEVAAAYAADAAPDADPEAARYAQYAEWRDAVAADDADGEGRAYWRDHLGAGAAPLRLPYRRGGTAGAAASPAAAIRLSRTADAALAEAFGRAMARPDLAGAGAEVVLQAAWWLLVARLAERTEILGGWAHDCRRDYAVFADTVGVFTKTLPLRLALPPETSVSEVAAGFAARLDEHRAFQELCPLDAAGDDRRPAVGFALAAQEAAQDRLLPGPAGFELCLEPALDAEGRLAALTLHADPRRYAVEALETLLDQVETLLARLPAKAATPFATYPLVGAREEARLRAFGRPAARALPAETLPVLVARHAAAAPDAPALVGAGRTLSYAALEDRVARLGAWFAAHGVGPERVVALDLPRSVDLVVAILAVWRAGGAYLPLDPAWPQARRDRLIALARPALTVALSADPAAGRHALGAILDGLGEARHPAEARDPSDMACLLFTSGSSGTPKGVVIEHAQIRAYVEAVIDALDLSGHGRFALTSTVAADLGNTVLFAALRLGACLVVADEAEMADGPAFARFLRANAVACAKLVPSHLAALLDGVEDPALPALLVLGGEPTPAGLVRRIRAAAPATRVANHYGPTEACVGVLVHPDAATAPPDESLPLSRVLAGSEAYILDAAGALAPTGEAGVLHLGGAQICRGYLPGTEAGGAGAFSPNPFGEGRLYRTGDRARLLPGGRLVLTGRADDQIKLRGHRVEPGEVEAALAGLAGVSQAAVRPFAGPDGATGLAAYVVAEPERTPAALLAALAEVLPAAWLPAPILRLDSLPRLANGKVDRAALPRPDAHPDAAGVPPRTELETVLTDAMAELLGLPAERLGAAGDFFAAGGNSLLVIKLTARIRKLLKVEIPPSLVFDHSTPATLAAALGAYASPDAIEETASLRLELAGLSEAERAGLAGVGA
ncbi:amino acid adenylation domain-containing protein [Methylobacterium sp. NMS14P]|uniref:non-ribosomal peptide synthetase n=1 Tax=Methylobacterium sp. NMS14P TaxID=2894310 RepID=UPI002358FFCB|nr:non-ribosomal peptide synthetase [Methylobacterium sp. NMS14P]WCS22932.1 amino acid adenylation domain-containing protein [Methylobacterium sp. NMS14P]